jgi:hypothetical protein
MSITGALTDFSLPEIFQFVEKGHKTGIADTAGFARIDHTNLCALSLDEQGRIVAAANQLNEQGLISMINQYPWVSQRVVTKLSQFCPANKPLGLYLRSQGALQVEHLEHLFQSSDNSASLRYVSTQRCSFYIRPKCTRTHTRNDRFEHFFSRIGRRFAKISYLERNF